MSVKEKAMSTAVFSHWVANFLVAYLVPQQVHLASVPGTFAFYAVCCAGALALVCAFVPEKKGLLLEEMGRLFGEPLESQKGVFLKQVGFLCQCVGGCLVYIGTCRGVFVCVCVYPCVSTRVCLSVFVCTSGEKRRRQDQA